MWKPTKFRGHIHNFELMNSCFSSGETLKLFRNPGVIKVLYQIKAIVQEEYSVTV